MKHVKYAEKGILLGDDAADALMEYARVISDNGGADTVTLRAISPDGNSVEATILLNASTALMTESTNADLDPPSNEDVVADLRDRIAAVSRPARAEAHSPWSKETRDIAETM